MWLVRKIYTYVKQISIAVFHIGQKIVHAGAYQLGLSNIDAIRQARCKPFPSFGWELWSEFHPRYRLEYWIGESHITVEVAKYSYNSAKNRLNYLEANTLRQTIVHSPQGIPHMITKLHWWDPRPEYTIIPYMPLHKTPRM